MQEDEDIDTQFRLRRPTPPRLGEFLLGPATDEQYNAVVGRSWVSDPWDLYAEGYKAAADQLVEDVRERRVHPLDAVVFPIVFLYRHYLELRLKQLMPVSARLLSLDPNFRQKHGLVEVWRHLRPRIEKVWANSKEKNDAIEEKLIELEKWDPKSDAFRYPVDTAGERNLQGLQYVNVRHLRDVVAGVAAVLDGIAIGMDEMADLKAEMEAEFRAETADYYNADRDYC
jgi:hypothetical protein